jgi:hypothetical protein
MQAGLLRQIALYLLRGSNTLPEVFIKTIVCLLISPTYLFFGSGYVQLFASGYVQLSGGGYVQLFASGYGQPFT